LRTSDVLWVALDLPSLDEAEHMARLLSDRVAGFKIGLELFTGHGPRAVEAIRRFGRVFLDLKLHDIPNTVSRAIEQAAKLDVGYLTVHAFGGRAMLEAARAKADELKSRGAAAPKLLAVTVLTSLFATDLLELGIERSPKDLVLNLAEMAKERGLDGVVASAHECEEIKKTIGSDMIVATPGIRPEGFAKGDQKRVVTPKKAILAGADLIIVGRPIVQAEDPTDVLDQIESELRDL